MDRWGSRWCVLETLLQKVIPSNMEYAIGALAVLLVGVGVGLWLGATLTQQACEERVERVYRLFEGTPAAPRTPGHPTNIDGPAARVTQAKVRQRRRWDLQK